MNGMLRTKRFRNRTKHGKSKIRLESRLFFANYRKRSAFTNLIKKGEKIAKLKEEFLFFDYFFHKNFRNFLFEN